MLEKVRSCINPLPGHRTQHRRSCSMVRHLTSLPPLNTLRAPSQITAASTKNCRREFSRPLPCSDDSSNDYGNKHTKLVTQCKVCSAIILSCFLNSLDTHTLYGRHIQPVSQIHLHHLRAILGIRWSDRVTNNEVLQRADIPSIEAMLLSRQLTWTGHVVWMNDDQLPKAFLYSELWQAKRDVGRPHLRYTDCTKRHLHAADINKRHWEEMAHDRSAWRTAVKQEPQKPKPKEQPMTKSNDNSRLQIEQISSQSSHADTAEGNWRLVLANHPMKELVR